jgi:hypothetical protein
LRSLTFIAIRQPTNAHGGSGGPASYTARVSTTTTTTPALKEWGAVAHALLDGRQTILLRKGGIHERAFTVSRGTTGGFLLYPTVAHSHAERVRAEHADLLPRGAADVGEDAVVVRCGLVLHDAIEVTRPAGLEAVADLHIWTDRSVREDRLEFRPRHALQVLVVHAVRLSEPRTLPRRDAYRGCRSWLDLPLPWDGRTGTPVHTRARLDADAARVREAVAG